MDEQPYTFEIREKYALLTGHGIRNSLKQIVEKAMILNEKAMESPGRFLLLDYRDVRFQVPITHTFDLIKIFETKLPLLKEAVIAVAGNPYDMKTGELFNEISMQRGFRIKVFADFDEAEKWLLEQRKIAESKP